jgi:uncharacterized hydrophobic protein (TIGR00271 family)
MLEQLKSLFDLRHDQDDSEAIDAAIRAGTRVGGTNLWVLIFAILIASVGLNVNSTAVVIGAMLISPLMGPLLALGYGAGISDYRLIRTAARSLAIFVALSLITSSVYFFISPLSQAQTELMARTSPTLWDVLIAFFGGCAGIVAQTRKAGSTIIPGAAIATALMPPLCTAGYGIATGNWEFVAGAAYLFLINAFFIMLATYMFVKLLRLPEHEGTDPRLQRRAHVLIVLGVFALAVPSAYLAYGLVQDQIFLAASKEVGRVLERQPNTIVLRKDVALSARQLSVTLSGERLPDALQAQLRQRLQANGFRQAKLVLRHVGADKIDVAVIREQLRTELLANVDGKVQERNVALDALHLQLSKLEQERAERDRIIRELMAQYPAISRIAVAAGVRLARGETVASDVMVLTVDARPSLSDADVQRIEAGLAVRFLDHPVQVVQTSPLGPTKPVSARSRKSRPAA